MFRDGVNRRTYRDEAVPDWYGDGVGVGFMRNATDSGSRRDLCRQARGREEGQTTAGWPPVLANREFPHLAQAQAAIGPDRWNPNTVSYDSAPSLAAEVAGKAWLFTLGPKGGSTPGGTEVAEIGPVPPITAPEYLLRINYGSGPPGATTPQHSHPGSEAFYVISGQLGQRDSARSRSCRGRSHDEWTFCRHAYGSLQQRYDRTERPHYVRGGRNQAVFVSSPAPRSDVMPRLAQLREHCVPATPATARRKTAMTAVAREARYVHVSGSQRSTPN